MKKVVSFFARFIFLVPLLVSMPSLLAQVGDDNPTGTTGQFNGNIATGGSYDPYTANASRSITDITVPSTVGAYPLTFTRTMNSRYAVSIVRQELGSGGNWSHNYLWHIPGPLGVTTEAGLTPETVPSTFTVNYPDGRSVNFSSAGGGGPYRAPTHSGISDRFQPFVDGAGGPCYLLLTDGGKVAFSVTSTYTVLPPSGLHPKGQWKWTYHSAFVGIIDPYGLETFVSHPSGGPMTITEPGGRQLKVIYLNGRIDKVEEHASSTAPARRAVQYNYSTFAGSTVLDSVVYFGDPNLTATYNYQTDNVLPTGRPLIWKCVDPMYSGPMWRIAYTFAPNASGVVSGQLQSENYLDAALNVGAAVSTLTINPATPNTRTETRGDGPSRTFNYSGGKLVNWTDFKGVTSSQTRDTNGFVDSSTDGNSHVTTFGRNPLVGSLESVTYPLTPPDMTPSITQVAYGNPGCEDPNNRDALNPYYVCSTTNERGYTTKYTRDTNHRVTRIDYPSDTPGAVYETFTYNNFGQVLAHRLTNNGVESFAYNPDGTVSEFRDAEHQISFYPTYRYSYDTRGRVSGITDAHPCPLGDPEHATNYEYNLRGQMTKLTHPAETPNGTRSFVTRIYNTDGTVQSVADELNHTTSFLYDDYKRVINTTNALGKSTVYYYGRNWNDPYLHTTSHLKAVYSPMSKWIHTNYDENWNPNLMREPAPPLDAWTSYGYDDAGNLTSVQDPRGNITTFAYDQRNRRTSKTDPAPFANQVTRWEYDRAGNLIKETRPDGIFRTFVYDQINRVVDTYGFGGEHTHYGRDYAGRVTQIVDAKGAAYGFGYDYLNRKISAIYPSDATGVTRSEAWGYNGFGNLYQYTNPATQIKTLVYDNRNRLTSSSWSAGGPSTATTYDAASRISTVVTNGGETTVAFGYDDVNRKIWEDQTLSGYPLRHVETPVDFDGNRTQLKVGADYELNFDYTDRNSLSHIKGNDFATLFTYQHDLNNNVTQRYCDRFGSSINTTYDELNRPWMWEARGNTNQMYARSWHQYDLTSHLVATWREEQAAKGERYAYDSIGQLTNAQYNADQVWTGAPLNAIRTVSYHLDALNRTGSNGVNENGVLTPYAPDDLNQYTDVGSQDFSYDANFNLTRFNDWNYTYNADNQLLSASNTARAVSSMDAVYDGLGRCVKRIIHTPSDRNPTAGVTTLFTYDGWNPIVEWDVAGTFAAWNIYGFRADEILWRYSPAKGHFLYHARPNGSVYTLLDYNGNVVEKYTYDAFGAPTITDWWPWDSNPRPASNYGNRFMFTGREFLAEMGIYDYRNRMYHPSLGRFLQPDPTGFDAGDMNLFRYGGGDPVNNTDPSGETRIFHAGPGGGYYTYVLGGNHDTNGGYMDPTQGCASGCQAWSGAPDTHDRYGNPTWYQGAAVGPNTERYTMVATGFRGGYYPSLSKKQTIFLYGKDAILNHTVFFLANLPGGRMLVLQQWIGHPAAIEAILAAGFFEVRVAGNQGNAGPGAGGQGAGGSLPSANPVGVGETTIWTWQGGAGWVARAQPVGPSGQNYGLGTIPSIGGGEAYRTPGYQGGFAMGTQVNLPGGGGPLNPYNSAQQ